MKEFKRYAVYFLPQADSALEQFGASWLGWDIKNGTEVPYPSWVTDGHAERVATPVKYGFHGTVYPPMRLAGGKSREALHAQIMKLCEAHPSFYLPALQLKDMGGFLCFMLSEPSEKLHQLAEDCVRGLHAWREPANEDELRKRNASRLTARQKELLAKWGYPYVLDEFRFHLTLTGKLPEPERSGQLELLQQHTHELTTASFIMSDLCLCGESDAGRFYLIERYPLAG